MNSLASLSHSTGTQKNLHYGGMAVSKTLARNKKTFHILVFNICISLKFISFTVKLYPRLTVFVCSYLLLLFVSLVFAP